MSSFIPQQNVNNDECFLCGRPNGIITGDFNFAGSFFRCVSCGDYAISMKTQVNYERHPTERERASHLAAERKIHGKRGFVLGEVDNATFSYQGESWPFFTMDTFLNTYPRDLMEILDRTLLNFAQMTTFPGRSFNVKRISIKQSYKTDRSVAFCSEWGDFVSIINYLEMDGCLEIERVLADRDTGLKLTGVNRTNVVDQLDAVPLFILPKGFQRIRELKSKAAGDHAQAFVAMWFDPSRDKYFDYIKRAAEEAGFENCLRIDNKEHNNKICDEIIAEIRKSQCVVADFTGNRGGVYFEAGFALGLGIPVIWLVDDNWWNETDDDGKRINDIHFDTRQYAHINYKDGDDLYERLKARILATVPLGK